VSPGGLTTRPCIAPSPPASPTSAAPHAASTTSVHPRGALDSNGATCGLSIHYSGHATHDSGIPDLPAALVGSPSGCTRATGTASTSAVTTGEDCTGGTSGQPSSDDHVGEAGLLADRLTLSATSASTLSPVPSSIHAALFDPN
jgi:hypothetical protein